LSIGFYQEHVIFVCGFSDLQDTGLINSKGSY